MRWDIAVVIVIIVLLCICAFTAFSGNSTNGQWLATDDFVQKSGLESLGALIKGPNMTLIAAIKGLGGSQTLTLCSQDYTCEWGRGTVTTHFLNSTTTLGSGPAPGQIIDDGEYEYSVENEGPLTTLVIFDTATIYLHLKKE